MRRELGPEEATIDLDLESVDHDDVSVLIRALQETDQRLEDLTSGQVDTVTDRDGRSFLLQRAQERWHRAGIDKQAAILDTLPANIALLDAEGVIVSTNKAWRDFACANAMQDANHGIGRNYLAVCDQATGDSVRDAARVSSGIRAALAGTSKSFSLEYPCDTPAGTRWFLFTVMTLNAEPTGAVIMHLETTDKKRGEEDLRRFAAAMDASPDGIFLIDRREMRFVHVNDAACHMHALDRDQLLAINPWGVLGNSRKTLEATYDDLIASGGFAEPEEVLWPRKGAPAIWIEIRRHARLISTRWTIVVLVRDVTARKETEARIAYLNRVHAVLSGINTLIVRVRDREELFREACRIAVEQGELGMSWMGIVDNGLDRVVPVASAGMDAEFLTAIGQRLGASSNSSPGNSLPNQVIAEKKIFVTNDSQNDLRNQLGDLHERHGIHSFAILPLLVADHAVGVFVLYAREKGFFHEEQIRLLTELAGDVAFAIEHIEKQERLDYLAYYDALTGLANRSLFLERTAQYMRTAVDGNHKIAVVLVDLERFRNINDSLGRSAGDSLLRQIAQWLTHLTRDPNLVARIDADRFAIVIPKVVDEEEVARLLEKAIEEFHVQSFHLKDKPYRIAAKMGVAVFPDDADDAETLFKHAEIALKKAKVAGHRYLFYTLRMTEAVAGRLNLENQLRKALELDQYELHYQPKIDAATGRISGAEALIRWNDPITGLVAPGSFIPILEETGLIHEVGRWALSKAVEDYLRWRCAGLSVVRLAVNLSPLQLRDRGFLKEMRRIVSVDTNAAAGLELEITESLIMQDVKLSIANLREVRAMGVRIAIDDFGTGFSSLSYLSKLPIDTVKIDRSFIQELDSAQGGQALVPIIINLVHALNLNVVAEGVETEQQFRMLQLLKCDEVQGFYFSKPLPAESFATKFLIPKRALDRPPAL